MRPVSRVNVERMRRSVRRAYLLRSLSHRFNPNTQTSTDMRQWVDSVTPLFPDMPGTRIIIRQQFDHDGLVTVKVDQIPAHRSDISPKAEGR